jgi:hypothetical protein
MVTTGVTALTMAKVPVSPACRCDCAMSLVHTMVVIRCLHLCAPLGRDASKSLATTTQIPLGRLVFVICQASAGQDETWRHTARRRCALSTCAISADDGLERPGRPR